MGLVFVIYQSCFRNKFQERTIQSLQKQTVKKFEVIFILDEGIFNSTLKLENYLKDLKGQFHKRIRFIVNYHSSGFTYSSNIAINLVNEDDYLIFVQNNRLIFCNDFVQNFYRELSEANYEEWPDIVEFNCQSFFFHDYDRQLQSLQFPKTDKKLHKTYKEIVHLHNWDFFLNIDPIIFNKLFRAKLLHQFHIQMRQRTHFYLLFLYKVMFYSHYYWHLEYNLGTFFISKMKGSLTEQIKQWSNIFTFYKSQNVSQSLYKAIEAAFFQFIVYYFCPFVLKIVGSKTTAHNILNSVNLKVKNRLKFFSKNNFLTQHSNATVQFAVKNWNLYFQKIIHQLHPAS